jgi:hypothetical protein
MKRYAFSRRMLTSSTAQKLDGEIESSMTAYTSTTQTMTKQRCLSRWPLGT